MKYIDRILLIVLCCFMLIDFVCKRSDSGSTTTIQSDTVSKVDSAEHSTNKTAAEIWHHEVQTNSDTQYVLMKLDSAALVEMLRKISEAYFKEWFYSDTTRDTAAQVEAIIQDSITQNSIKHRHTTLKNLRPITEITNTKIEAPRIKIFAGGFLGSDSLGILWGGRLTLMNKREDQITVDYAPDRKMITAGYAPKISFRKHPKRARDVP